MNNSYLLKKQLKDNEEELSNYLRDMNIWKDQMKRKEPTLPLKNPGEKKPKISENKILSCDYSNWDKFDIVNAGKKLDNQDELQKNNHTSSDYLVSNKLQSKISEALYEKKLGNALVQKEKWAEAITRYTRAIEYYDKDPIFYANRALCYLKLNKYKLTINDCTSSLKLDSTYVKTYQRRSAAYMALEMYDEAKKDLDSVLKLEPNNKKAKIDIEIINSKIKDAIPKNNILLKNNSLNNLMSNVEGSIKSVIPHWPSRPSCKQITSKQKPPHLRSKKPFCTLKIKDIQEDQEEINNMHLLQTTLKEVCEKKQEVISSVKKDLMQTEKKQDLVVPPPPQTYVQLKQDWAYLQKDSKLLFQYFRQIPGRRLPFIVRNSMDHDLFVDMIRILKLEFIQNGCEVTDHLIGISELPRIQMLVMFCSYDEILCIKELLHHVSQSTPESVFKRLKSSFGI
ncbi:RNA polymerase II-associated protein 3-like [Sipha flava]|uniref:RNA polymerase II-associated protein 3 n=2 Tax=Sipha flava TaxID=143950 RepID=A0A8B8FZ81_9HEMI|nr:RNA polymerase II-associated protein 3-like [Sipha flava]